MNDMENEFLIECTRWAQKMNNQAIKNIETNEKLGD